MPLVLHLGSLALSLPVTCSSARGNVTPRGNQWALLLSDGIGSAVFLLDDACSDGAFLATLEPGAAWRILFFDHTQCQLALEDANDSLDLMLRLYPKGVPVPATDGGASGPWSAETSRGPSLWVSVCERDPG